jgi:hydrogenase large subunit
VQKKPEFKEPVDMVLKKLDLPLSALFSTLGRTAARGPGSFLGRPQDALLPGQADGQPQGRRPATANIDKWEPVHLAQGNQGRRLHRGATRRAGPLDPHQGRPHRQLPVRRPPTTWNGSPRDSKGQIGAFEASLMNTPVAKADQPLEILRTLHSFDPCLACSTHVMAPDGAELTKVRVR